MAGRRAPPVVEGPRRRGPVGGRVDRRLEPLGQLAISLAVALLRLQNPVEPVPDTLEHGLPALLGEQPVEPRIVGAEDVGSEIDHLGRSDGQVCIEHPGPLALENDGAVAGLCRQRDQRGDILKHQR